MSKKTTSLVVVALVALLALSLTYVPDVAVRESFGGSAVALQRGFHFRLPLYHRLYRYDTTPVNVNDGLEILTKDNASFKLPMSISAWTSPGDLLTFHAASGGREPAAFIRERIQEAVRASVQSLNADELLTSDLTRVIGPPLSADLISHGIADEGIEIGRPPPHVVLNAVVDYLSRGFPASARSLAEFAVAEAPGETLHHTAMGIVLEAEERSADAERAYLDALYIDPSGVEPMSQLFLIDQKRDDPEGLRRLERLLLVALEKTPDSSMHHHWIGQLYMRTGRRDDARTALRNAIRLKPEDADFRVTLGGMEIQQGQMEEARTALEEALRLRADHPLALFNMGVSYAIEGGIDEAIEYFHRAERAGPPNHPLLNSLAQAYEEKGDLERAADYLRRTLALRPDQPERRAALRRIEAAINKRTN
jgi:tetratricopeptide (TPR) repeat protein